MTLLVTPEQGNILAELEAEGKSHLSLVFRGDNEKAQQFITIQEDVINKIHHPELSEEPAAEETITEVVSEPSEQSVDNKNPQTGESTANKEE